MMRLRLLGVLLALWLAMPAPAAAEGAKTSPEDAARFIDALGAQALSVLSAQDTTLEVREQQVRKLLAENFALEQIGRFVLGQAWRRATPEQQAEYQRLFAEYVLATYSRRLGGYSGETFEIVKAEPVGKRDAVVFTRISRPDAPPLACGWRVRLMNGRHQILDVIVEGISMITAQRSEFASVVKAKGIEGLIENLRLQVTKFSAQAS